MVVDLSQSLFSGVSFGNLNVLEQWFSNFLVLGTLYILKNYCGSPRAFVYVIYLYLQILAMKSESESRSVVSNSLWPHELYRILPARILEWVAFPFSRRSLQSRDWTQSLTLQADSLPAEPQGKPKNTGVSGLSLLQQIFPTQELKWGLLHFRHILFNWAMRHKKSSSKREVYLNGVLRQEIRKIISNK